MLSKGQEVSQNQLAAQYLQTTQRVGDIHLYFKEIEGFLYYHWKDVGTVSHERTLTTGDEQVAR